MSNSLSDYFTFLEVSNDATTPPPPSPPASSSRFSSPDSSCSSKKRHRELEDDDYGFDAYPVVSTEELEGANYDQDDDLPSPRKRTRLRHTLHQYSHINEFGQGQSVLQYYSKTGCILLSASEYHYHPIPHEYDSISDLRDIPLPFTLTSQDRSSAPRSPDVVWNDLPPNGPPGAARDTEQETNMPQEGGQQQLLHEEGVNVPSDQEEAIDAREQAPIPGPILSDGFYTPAATPLSYVADREDSVTASEDSDDDASPSAGTNTTAVDVFPSPPASQNSIQQAKNDDDEDDLLKDLPIIVSYAKIRAILDMYPHACITYVPRKTNRRR